MNLYIIILLIFVLIGIILKNKKTKNINKNLILNYLGNFFLCHLITILFYSFYGYKSVNTYFMAILMSYLCLILHIKDVTGKSIEQIIIKIKFNYENLKNNIFIRFTLFLFIFFGIICIIIKLFVR